jgi:DNA polymerase III subunit epsilon
MREPAHRLIKRSLVWAGVCAGAGAAMLLPDVLRHRPLATTTLVVGGATFAAALLLYWRSWRAADRLGRGIEGVRTAVLNLVADRDAAVPRTLGPRSPAEVEAMLGSLALYQDTITRERHAPDHRLLTVLGSLASGVVLFTDQGQVSLLNHTARELLGAERARVGTSLFATLSRESVLAAMSKARRAGRMLESVFERLDGVLLQGRIVLLPDDEGAVLIFPPVELDRHRPGVEFDLKLHDVPPATGPLHLGLKLDDLPVLVVDTETTGLDVVNDRIVSLGAVCANGTRLFRSRMQDDLVDPGVPIPPASTKVHGITDAMVRDARAFPEVWADFQRLAQGRVIVGHNIPFDLTILRHECARHGRPWEDLVFIDTLRLASLLNPSMGRLDLEGLAQIYQVELHGRHTALGDALVTAELFFRMIPRLQMQGFGTLGALLDFHEKDPVDVIAGQKEQGWIHRQPEGMRP